MVTMFKKKQSFNEAAVVLIDYEMKVIELMDWAIDAPVENNLSIVPVARVLPLRKPITNFEVTLRNQL